MTYWGRAPKLSPFTNPGFLFEGGVSRLATAIGVGYQAGSARPGFSGAQQGSGEEAKRYDESNRY